MPFLNKGIFLLIIFSLLFLLGGIAVGMASLAQGILFLRTAPENGGFWIMPHVGMVAASIGIVARRHRYRKFPFPSFLSVGLDWMNREIKKVKWKPRGIR